MNTETREIRDLNRPQEPTLKEESTMREAIAEAEHIADALRRARGRIGNIRVLARDRPMRAKLAQEISALSTAERLFRRVTSHHVAALAVPPNDMTIQECQLWEEAMLALRAALRPTRRPAMSDTTLRCPRCDHDVAGAGPAGICIGCPCPEWHGATASEPPSEDDLAARVLNTLAEVGGGAVVGVADDEWREVPEVDAITRRAESAESDWQAAESTLAALRAEVERLRAALDDVAPAGGLFSPADDSCVWCGAIFPGHDSSKCAHRDGCEWVVARAALSGGR
jgi:hypothetical protein